MIAACEERLLKAKTIDVPFMVANIQGGILKQYLIEEDYLAPTQVYSSLPKKFFFKMFLCF